MGRISYFIGTVIIASAYRKRVKSPVLFFGIWHSFVEFKKAVFTCVACNIYGE